MAWQIVAVLIGVVAGGLLITFWDEIKAWADRVLGSILDSIDRTVEVVSDGVVYLIKKGYEYYKEIEIFLKNRRTGQYEEVRQRVQIPSSQMPPEVKKQLDEREKLESLRLAT